MYKAFNYKPSQIGPYVFNDEYFYYGNLMYETFHKNSRSKLESFIKDNGHIDAEALSDNWFGVEKADVFISYSHDDLRKVKMFAGWLNRTFDLKVFVDSCVWGNCNDILREIDNKYCKKITGNYDYDLRNRSTSHVHAILSTALAEMMDKSECIIFFNTPQSISTVDVIGDSDSEITHSPWIYYELSTVKKLRITPPSRPRQIREATEGNRLGLIHYDSLESDYNVHKYLKDMPVINDNTLYNWAENHNKSRHPLDVLYDSI